jgi:Ca2+-binding RTX toxin-like protein
MTRSSLAVAALVAAVALPAAAPAKTSHEGWPKINGILWINKHDRNRTKHGTSRSDELLGGHGSDTLYGRDSADVIWGDYKPSRQPTRQVDHLYGGGGDDFIYASHGTNYIYGGAGDDRIKMHFGHGFVDCGPGNDLLEISRRAQRHTKIVNCETISHHTLGY